MDIEYPEFGAIVIDGTRYDHDVIVEGGEIRKRSKKPSKPYRDRYGHTPLSPDEDIPWSSVLVVGTGASGRLPIMPETWDQAEAREVEILAMPTARAVDVLGTRDAAEVYAVLHVTC